MTNQGKQINKLSYVLIMQYSIARKINRFEQHKHISLKNAEPKKKKNAEPIN